MTTGGIHLTLAACNPDLATFAKGMANGYAMAALVGRGDVDGGRAVDVHQQHQLDRAHRSDCGAGYDPEVPA